MNKREQQRLIHHERLKGDKRTTPPPFTPNNKPVLVFLIALLLLFFLISLCGCSKYQVVQELKVNMYHLHNPKNGKMEVIFTEDSLTIGKWYNLKTINVIDIEQGD